MSDEPTILSLYDTITVLSRKNPKWRDDKFCQKILAWAASLFIETHVAEVCNAECPELIELCSEYREHKTMFGLFLPPFFGQDALEYIAPEPKLNVDFEKFGSSPVRDSYFFIDKGI